MKFVEKLVRVHSGNDLQLNSQKLFIFAGHEMANCEGLVGNAVGKPDIALGGEVQFVFVRLCVLKEYLRKTLAMPNLPFA